MSISLQFHLKWVVIKLQLHLKYILGEWSDFFKIKGHVFHLNMNVNCTGQLIETGIGDSPTVSKSVLSYGFQVFLLLAEYAKSESFNNIRWIITIACYFYLVLSWISGFTQHVYTQQNNSIYKNCTYPLISTVCGYLDDPRLFSCFVGPLFVLRTLICLLIFRKICCTFSGFPASFAHLTSFQQWQFDLEIHLLTEDSWGTQLLQKVTTFTMP